jgi:hypothetical protein
MQQAPTKEMLKHFVIIRLMFVSLSGRPCRDMGGRRSPWLRAPAFDLSVCGWVYVYYDRQRFLLN